MSETFSKLDSTKSCSISGSISLSSLIASKKLMLSGLVVLTASRIFDGEAYLYRSEALSLNMD
jgi:hypothetical protein